MQLLLTDFSSQLSVQQQLGNSNTLFDCLLTSYLVGYIVATTAPVRDKKNSPQQKLQVRITLNTFGKG